MKTIFTLLFLFIFFIGIAMAGEKEELQLKIQWYQEHLKALQYEYLLTNKELKELQDKLETLNKNGEVIKDKEK